MQMQAASPGMPLFDITTRQQPDGPTGSDQCARASHSPAQGCSQHVVGVSTPSEAVAHHASGLHTPVKQGIAEASVQEQCLSAETWLRGLAEECLAKLHAPVNLLPAATHPAHQVGIPTASAALHTYQAA